MERGPKFSVNRLLYFGPFYSPDWQKPQNNILLTIRTSLSECGFVVESLPKEGPSDPTCAKVEQSTTGVKFTQMLIRAVP